MSIPYPTFTKLQDASRQGIPVARIAMAAIIMLGRTKEMEKTPPQEVFDAVIDLARTEPSDDQP